MVKGDMLGTIQGMGQKEDIDKNKPTSMIDSP